MQLVIVESPTKSKTISQFLGKDYEVVSSYGHIRDLPKGKFGIDVENDFEPQYVVPRTSQKVVTALKKRAQKADEVILATDEDREGEAISHHLATILNLQDPKRIVFHEITKEAIQEALKNPRSIDRNLVDAQQARRILDRIVGYKLSPFLWRKIARGLSAGRVQSAALRLIVEREREIERFQPQEYWGIEAELKKGRDSFVAQLAKKDGEQLDKFAIKTEQEAKAVLEELEGATYVVSSVEQKDLKRNPLPPFTTSTLQQEAAKRLRYSAKQTMRLAQQLYETGHITYHRTDSVNLSEYALREGKNVIVQDLGESYSFQRTFKTKAKSAQEAHEAIRPTYPARFPESVAGKLTPQQAKLYELIWRRFLASQMTPARFSSINAEIAAKNYTFKATGQTLQFDGFLKIYPMKFEETDLPKLERDEGLELEKLASNQHFTQPPARYTEATLVKILEEQGIGRPSTYASIISTIQDRGYVEKNEQRRFFPTELGKAVNDLLVEHFPSVVDIKFTAGMEEQLDEIAEGKLEWLPMLKTFYGPFSETLTQKEQEVSKASFATETDRKCPECGSPLVIRLGRFGKFYACSSFPNCRHTEPLEKEQSLGISCPKCKEGEIVPKRTKRGKVFYGCSRYPDCDNAYWNKPTGEVCKECGSLMVENRKKAQCSNQECPTNKK